MMHRVEHISYEETVKGRRFSIRCSCGRRVEGYGEALRAMAVHRAAKSKPRDARSHV